MTALRTRGLGARSIVPIGGTSTVFTRGLLADLTSSRTFDKWTVHLVDINGDGAENTGRVRSGSVASEPSPLALDHLRDVLRISWTACTPELSRSLS